MFLFDSSVKSSLMITLSIFNSLAMLFILNFTSKPKKKKKHGTHAYGKHYVQRRAIALTFDKSPW